MKCEMNWTLEPQTELTVKMSIVSGHSRLGGASTHEDAFLSAPAACAEAFANLRPLTRAQVKQWIEWIHSLRQTIATPSAQVVPAQH